VNRDSASGTEIRTASDVNSTASKPGAFKRPRIEPAAAMGIVALETEFMSIIWFALARKHASPRLATDIT